MNDKMTPDGCGAAEYTDATGNTQITDFTQIVSCAVGQSRLDQQRQKIRAELVRTYFGDAPATSPGSPSLRIRLLKMFNLD